MTAPRRGVTLLELVIASMLATTLVTATAVLLRGMHSAWDGAEGDIQRIEAAHATVRHIVRALRQTTDVTAITLSTDAAGSISALDASGNTLVWARNAGTNDVNYGIGSADQLLAQGIAELRFTGYKADGTTTTTVPAEIQAVRCEVRIDLPRELSTSRKVVGWAWLRSY